MDKQTSSPGSRNKKIRIEIYEDDLLSGGGCRCGPGQASTQDIRSLREVLMERAEIVANIKREFKEVEIVREVVDPFKELTYYPESVRPYISLGTALPFVLINGELVAVGTFPTLEEFRGIIKEYLKLKEIDE